MQPWPADRREWRTARPATEPQREPDEAAVDTAVMDGGGKLEECMCMCSGEVRGFDWC